MQKTPAEAIAGLPQAHAPLPAVLPAAPAPVSRGAAEGDVFAMADMFVANA